MSPSPRQDRYQEKERSKFTDAIKIWASPVLILVSMYFIKLQFEQMLANQETLMNAYPELREKTKTLEREMRELQGISREHSDQLSQLRTYFLKPEDIKVTRN